MPGYLLDTNVLSELRRPKPNRFVEAFLRAQSEDNLFVSDITLAEIRFGAQLRSDPDERAVISNWLETIIRPLFDGRSLRADEEIWLIWKTLEYGGRRARYTYPQPDLVIAAIALRYNLTVATRDTEPFERARVPVVNPWRPAA